MQIPWEHLRVRARLRASYGHLYKRASVSTLVHPGVKGCPDPHTQSHRAAPSAFVCSHTLVHVRTCGYKNTCVYGWLRMYRRASVYLYMYIYISVYIYNDVYIPVMYLFCTYMHACTWVCTDTLCTQASICVCAPADATRIDACTCISRHRFSQMYNVHGHPSIFRCMYFGAAPRRACGRAVVCAGARAGV
jgi:hypothetical protein